MNFYDALFQLSDFWLFCVCVLGVWLLTMLAAALMAGLMVVLPHRGIPMVGTVLTGILLPTGMVIAFVANDVWQNDAAGRAAVADEASAISDSLRVAKYLSPELSEAVRVLVQDYTKSVIKDEWPILGSGHFNDASEHYLEQLMVKAVQLQSNQAANSSLAIAGQELRRYVTRIELARDARLRVADTLVRMPKWVSVLVMLFVAACVLAELHITSRRSLAVVTTLFALGFGVTIYLIAVYDRPFTGKTIITAEPLQRALTRAYILPDL